MPAKSKYGRRIMADIGTALTLIGRRQPIMGDDAAAEFGWTLERWWVAMSRSYGCWEPTGKGLVLTAAGRRVAAKLPT